jgi:hypothetical protein
MTQRLKNSIEVLYNVFSKYKGNPNMEGSSNYDNLEEWNKELFSKELNELSAQDLLRFAGKVMTTWGRVDDYKHFLPRIFELTAELDPPYEVWIAFDKLNYGNWDKWEENERNAIYNYMLSLWDNLVTDDSEKAEWFFIEYFSSIARFYPKFSDILNIWEHKTGRAPTKHLTEFILNEREKLFDKGYIDGLHKNYDAAKELIDWLLAEQTIKRLQEAFYNFEREEFAEKISWAENILTDEKKNKSHNSV